MLNNDFKVLVGKYNRYTLQKKKSRNRKILFVTVLALGAYVIGTFDFDKNIKLPEGNAAKHLVPVANPVIKEKVIEAKPIITHKVKTSKEEPLSEKILPRKPQVKATAKPKKTKPIQKTKEESSPKPKLQVTSRARSLEQLTINQERINNYSSTIALANYHYSQKEYREAIKWAIKASQKNRNKERSWMIYAKSKIMLGQKSKAKAALEAYLKRHRSTQLQTLLKSL